MKRFFFLLSLLICLTFSVNALFAGNQNVLWTISGVNTSASGGKDVNTTLKTSSIDPTSEKGVWTAVASKSYANSNSGAQFGSGSYTFAGTISLSGTSIPNTATIKTITIKCTSSGSAYKVDATVNGQAFGSQVTLSDNGGKVSTEKDFSFTGSQVLGENGSIVLTFSSGGKKNVIIKSILVTYTPAEGGAALQSIAVSGAPTKTSYNTGDNFDPAGLTVTGTYSDASTAPITSGITWSYNPSQTLAKNQTSIGVTATVDEISSPKYTVTGLTVTDLVVSSWQVIAPSDLATGDVVVLTMLKNSVYYAAPNNGGTNAPTATVVTVVGDNLSNAPAETLQWTVTVVEEGVYQFSVGSNYLKCTDTNNGVKVGTGDYNTFDINTTNEKQYLHTTETMSGATSGRYLGIYNTQDWRCYNSVNTNIKDGSLVIFKDASAAVVVAKPTISGDENFVTSTTVTISHADADHIYYTTNGDAPTISSTPYSAPFTLTETATVKAIAVKGGVSSAVAEKTFTKLEPLTTMDQIFAAAETAESTPTQVAITFNNWVVTGVKNSNAYVTDGTKGFIIYTSSHGFNVGDIISGTAVCKVQLYNGSAELTELPATKVTVNTGGSVSPVVLDADGIAALTGANTGSVIKISGECSEESSKFYIGGVQLYNSLYSFSVSAGTSYDCTGIYVLFNSTKEILPRSAADIVETSTITVTGVDMTESTASVEAGETVTLHASVEPSTATNKTIVWSVESGDIYASVDQNGVVTGLAAGTAVIRAASDENASIYEECTVTVTAADPTKHKVTFDATVDYTSEATDLSITKGDLTIAVTDGDGRFNNKADYRPYKNSVFTVSCSNGNIIKIEFTCTSGKPITGFGDVEGLDKDNEVWTGNAASVSFPATNAQVQMTKLVITYKEDSRAASGLAWSTDAVELAVGDAFTAPTLTNPNNIAASEITIASNNPNVATVNNGVVSLVNNATGEATITATFAGNTTYKPATVSYTITVEQAGASQNVVILAQNGTKYYAMSTTIESETAVPIEVEYDGTKVTVAKAADKDAIQWTKKTNGDNTTFQTKDEDKLYLKGTSGGGTLALNANVCNWTWDGTNNCYVTGTRGFIYRVSVNGFKNYSVNNLSNADYIAPAVIVIDPANIVVTSKVSAELAYNPTSVTLTVGGTFTPATLTYASGFDGLAAVTYGSNNETLATVAADGTVTLAEGKTGTATITATFTGNDNYLAGSASYTITVNAPAPTPTGTTYTKVTSTGDITDGEYLIVYETTSVAFNGALETLDAEGNSVAVVISGDEIAGTTAIDAAVFTIDVTAGTLQSASGKYIGVSSNSNGLKQTENASTYTHTFSIDSEGNAVILANFEGSTMKLRYNPSTSAGNLRFRYYKNDGQQAIQLYKKESATPPTPDYGSYNRDGLTIGNYATICLPNGGTIEGAKLFDLEYYDGANTLYFLEVNGNAMVAGRPYIFLPSGTSIEVTYTDNANASAGSFNGLVGSYSQQQVPIGATEEEKNYILYQNAYYLVNSEAYVGANRAYIHMASVPTTPTQQQQGEAPRRRVAMAVNGEQVATGIDAINASDKPMKVMIDGKLYIIRAGQMYDMTGSKVK